MPTYVYECPSCKGTEQRVHGPNEEVTMICVHYDGNTNAPITFDMVKKPQTFGIHWKEGKPT